MEGRAGRVAASLSVPIEEYVRRGVDCVKPVTDFKSVADTSKFSEYCIDNVKAFWNENNSDYVKQVIRRRCKMNMY